LHESLRPEPRKQPTGFQEWGLDIPADDGRDAALQQIGWQYLLLSLAIVYADIICVPH
jgi:hypothetical protein